jgi:ABC-type antimicrobial peptide transport system permease subunit
MTQPVRRTSSMAIVSLVAGLLGWTFAPWLGSIIAIITGHMARTEIRRDPAGLEGDGLAVAGLVLGWAMILLSVFTVLAIVLFFGGLAALAALAAGISA